MLKQAFFNLVKKYTDNLDLVKTLWLEIEEKYDSRKRYYHNLSHLENLLQQLLEVKSEIKN